MKIKFQVRNVPIISLAHPKDDTAMELTISKKAWNAFQQAEEEFAKEQLKLHELIKKAVEDEKLILPSEKRIEVVSR